MLSINVNGNVDDYREGVIAGLDAKQTLWMILGIVSMVGGILLLVLVFHMPIAISVYASMPVAVPFILTGFSCKHGMSYWQRRKQKKNMERMPALMFISTESQSYYRTLADKKQSGEKTPEEAMDDFEKTAKMIKMLLGALIGIVVLVFVIVVFVKVT